MVGLNDQLEELQPPISVSVSTTLRPGPRASMNGWRVRRKVTKTRMSDGGLTLSKAQPRWGVVRWVDAVQCYFCWRHKDLDSFSTQQETGSRYSPLVKVKPSVENKCSDWGGGNLSTLETALPAKTKMSILKPPDILCFNYQHRYDPDLHLTSTRKTNFQQGLSGDSNFRGFRILARRRLPSCRSLVCSRIEARRQILDGKAGSF